MRSKLFFIANIARYPTIVFLDEPLNSRDNESLRKVIIMLKEYVSTLERDYVQKIFVVILEQEV